MADLTISSENVRPGSGARTQQFTAGADIDTGEPVYQDPDGNFRVKPSLNGTRTQAKAIGVALHSAETGQPVVAQTHGKLLIGGAGDAGEIYIVSATAGGIAPVADLGNEVWPTIIGIGDEDGEIDLFISHGTAATPPGM
jgi:hypothetical protein